MWLAPDILFDRVEDISLEYLSQNGIKGLVLDVDNTLTADGSHEITQSVADWLEMLHNAGVKAIIISNNDYERVKPFADKIGLPFTAKALKPRTAGFRRALKLLGLTKEEAAVVGDQLFTDILLSKFAHCRSIMVRPVSDDIYPFVIFKRKLEKPFMKRFERREK